MAVVGDAELALQGMLDRIDNGNVDEQFVDRCRKIRTADEQAIQEEIGADHSQIVSIIRRLLPDECPVVRDSTVPGYTWGKSFGAARPGCSSRHRPRVASRDGSSNWK